MHRHDKHVQLMKSEIRDPRSEGRPHSEIRSDHAASVRPPGFQGRGATRGVFGVRISALGFPSDFGARISVFLFLALFLSTTSLFAQQTNRFPAAWGPPPRIETRDYRKLPGDYGFGSSTLARWIQEHLDQDRKGGGATAVAAKPLYQNNFDQLPLGKLPEEFMVLAGDFAVQAEGGNKFVELPGAPLDTFSLLFGPAVGADTAVAARIFGTGKGRRFPTFAVGLGGASGWRLVVAPGKQAIELWRDEELKASAPFTWKSGSWTALRLQIRKVGAAWKVEGQAWESGGPEPSAWGVSFDATDAPLTGRASVTGSPFAGTPIRFDDLVVSAATR